MKIGPRRLFSSVMLMIVILFGCDHTKRQTDESGSTSNKDNPVASGTPRESPITAGASVKAGYINERENRDHTGNVFRREVSVKIIVTNVGPRAIEFDDAIGQLIHKDHVVWQGHASEKGVLSPSDDKLFYFDIPGESFLPQDQTTFRFSIVSGSFSVLGPLDATLPKVLPIMSNDPNGKLSFAPPRTVKPSATRRDADFRRTVVRVIAMDSQGKSVSMGRGVVVSGGKVLTACSILESAKQVRVLASLDRSDTVSAVTENVIDTRKIIRDHDVCEINGVNLPIPAANTMDAGWLHRGERAFLVAAEQGLDPLAVTEVAILTVREEKNAAIIEFSGLNSPPNIGAGLFTDDGRLVGILVKHKVGGRGGYVAVSVKVAR